MAIKDDEKFWAMKARLADLLPRLNERDRRLALATEAKSSGRGGISAVHEATGHGRFKIVLSGSPSDDQQLYSFAPS